MPGPVFCSRNVAIGSTAAFPRRTSASCTANRDRAAESSIISRRRATTPGVALRTAQSAACARTAGCGSSSSRIMMDSPAHSDEQRRAPRSLVHHSLERHQRVARPTRPILPAMSRNGAHASGERFAASCTMTASCSALDSRRSRARSGSCARSSGGAPVPGEGSSACSVARPASMRGARRRRISSTASACAKSRTRPESSATWSATSARCTIAAMFICPNAGCGVRDAGGPAR